MSKNIFRASHQAGNVAMIFAIIVPVLLGLIALSLNATKSFGDLRAAQSTLDFTNLNYLRTYIMQGDLAEAVNHANEIFEVNITEDGWQLELGAIQRSERHLVVKSTAEFVADSDQGADLKVTSEVRVPILAISAVLVTDVSASMGGRFKPLQNAMNTFGENMYALPKDFSNELEVSIVPYASSVNISDVKNKPGKLLESTWSYKKNGDDNIKVKFNDLNHYASDAPSCKTHKKDHDAVTEKTKGSLSDPRFDVFDEEWREEERIEGTYWEDKDGDGIEEEYPIKKMVPVCHRIKKDLGRPWSGCIQTKISDFDPPYNKTSVKRHQFPPVVPKPDNPGSDQLPRCPNETASMQVEIPTFSKFRSFVNNMEKGYGTAHDVGMLWGLRVLEPNWSGFFGVQKREWNDDFAPKYLIFLSDGRSTNTPFKFGDYKFDSAEGVKDRTNKICSYLKDKGVTIFGISYEHPKQPEKIETVANCASPGRHYESDTSNIETIFSGIAYRIITESLRVSD